MTMSKALLFAIPLLFILIYHQVFIADYAYLDEIHQLWHNNDDSNFVMFYTQGRWLTGLLFQKLFSSISKIEQLKFLRWFSLGGWIITALFWSVALKKWVQRLNLPAELWPIGSLYMVCSISVCIYIGWASCMEVFLAIIAGLISGHLLFMPSSNQQKQFRRLILPAVSSFLVGIICLFIYQNAFGIFLIPFFLHYTKSRSAKPTRSLVLGVITYLLIHIVYFFLFKHSLKIYEVEASTRTAVHFNVLEKISFFFSGPFPQGFSMNLLFLARSLYSQIFYLLIFALWVIIVFTTRKGTKIFDRLMFIGVTLFLLALIYLPSMIASENFPSYRTLAAFNLAVFLMVTESLLQLFQKEKTRRVFSLFLLLWLLVTAIYTFNFQYINPLKKEYRVLKDFMQAHYKPGLNQVYFVRADKFLFGPEFHTNVYRDEFGVPSTYKDWVPEPIVKQMVFELTKKRKIAEGMEVIQFEHLQSFQEKNLPIDSTALVINMDSLFVRGE